MDTIKPFKGFLAGKTRLTRLPNSFFTELLPEINHLGELKLILYLFWRLEQIEGNFRYVQKIDLLNDKRFLQGLAENDLQAETVLDEALEGSVKRGVLLAVEIENEGQKERLFFLNTPKGQAAVEAIKKGQWSAFNLRRSSIELEQERPNIYRLYEENIGLLTPLIADALREAEETYPQSWIDEAVQIAVLHNVRNWKYIEAILHRWQERGRNDKKDQGDTERDRRKYFEGTDFVEH